MLSLLFALFDRWFAPAPKPERVGWLGQVEAYAHRGLHGVGVPENSLAAFRLAMERGLGIECDVQRTSDGMAVVFHDWDLDRLTAASGPVIDRKAAQLQDLALLGAEGERIPALRDLLDLVNGRVPLLIELKSKREMHVVPLCLAVRRLLEGYRGPVAVMSFDPRVSHWFQRHSPHIVHGLVMTEEGRTTLLARVRRHLALWHAEPDFLAYDVRDLPSRFAASQRRRGLPLLTWTVRSPDLAERAAIHADAPIAEGAGVAGSGAAA
ncbi:glycerophosphodiester phosphodiesterase family protein [Novosphingobium percolationis]|uniref:glycerophosphodiester phosphodiesterase family protein n=1 Tax=Novosphingobium percolationis TaxID=2871811 RepID=UPI001CD6DB58|nr:glycerophosphodiester phosphodiesterase family protein [Novosphingobium percolationis]MCH7629608.1 glycerophosphodiester phosphodiesterase [Pseudomonadota bacterium]